MKFIADFHIHSHYSRATSKLLVPCYLDFWARMKGISVVGTGDFTHPGWTKELEEQLEPAEDGLFKLKQEFRGGTELETPFLGDREVRFMLTAEISNIYKKNDKVRKVHNVVFAPDFETVHKIQQKLTAIGGNITSDGRPILGLDSRDLLEMCLDASEDIFFVPAHIWTPWFSALGSKSGFDTIAEAYGDLAHHIYAVETGLSTDPPMNWMCGFLDNYTLLSNSDAHSPERLGRNANCFDTELSYRQMMEAMKTADPERFGGTIDLFPQEGKYHYDGHRKCGICWNPVETLKHDGRCSQCGKPVTVGVMNRVVQLSDREDLSLRKNRLPFRSIIPLKELLAELAGVGPNSKKVDASYWALIKQGVPELELLLETPISEIEKLGGGELAEAVRRMRDREIHIQEGFDGEYGVIKVFAPGETPKAKEQNLLFKEQLLPRREVPEPRKMIDFDMEEYRRLRLQVDAGEISEKDKSLAKPLTAESENEQNEPDWLNGLNERQLAAVTHFEGPALVIAGPGTGKTRVLTQRVLYLIKEKGVRPENILAVTFTNKAATEIADRLDELLKEKGSNRGRKKKEKPTVTTFHALGYSILKEQGEFSILDPDDKKRVLQRAANIENRRTNWLVNEITKAKQLLLSPDDLPEDNDSDVQLKQAYHCYQSFLKEHHLHDLEDLVTAPVWLFRSDPELVESYRKRFQWIAIDEYQDINYAQYCLIRSLMPGPDESRSTGGGQKKANLCAIGDPDQAIYGFRGADVQYIQRFQQDYPNATVYMLEQSYRCSDSILKASGGVMGKGRGETNDPMLKGLEEGVKIRIVKNSTHKSEAEFVARSIEQMMGGLRFFSMDSSITQGHKEKEIDSLEDFVVLCRVKSQIEAIEKAFLDHSIPYQTIGEEPFFKSEPVRSVLDVMKLALNPQNKFLKEKLVEKKIIPDIPDALKELSAILEGNFSVTDSITSITNLFFSDLTDQDHVSIKRLIDLATEFKKDVHSFIQYVTLGTSPDTYQKGMERVTIMTLHASKGLEFKAVFIIGCEEGLLPYTLFASQPSNFDEERRLLYVGMTRAKKFLFLSHANERFIKGRQYQLNRSPFLDNIERHLIEHSKQIIKKKEPEQRSLF